MEIFKQTNFDFLGKKWPFIILSLLLTAVGIVSLLVKGGPKYGIDFNGGALMDVNFKQRPQAEDIRSALRKKISGEIEVQEVANSQEVLISTSVRDPKGLEVVRNDMLATLNTAFNPGCGRQAGHQHGHSKRVDRGIARSAGESRCWFERRAAAGLGVADPVLPGYAAALRSDPKLG